MKMYRVPIQAREPQASRAAAEQHQPPSAPAAEMSQLRAPQPFPKGGELDYLEQELATRERQLQQLAADFENYKRHAQRELAAIRRQATQQVLCELGETVKGLERALEESPRDADALRQGVSLVTRGLSGILRKHGLERIPTAGQPFDPELHEAIFTEQDPDLPRGTVVRELTPGFRSAERVLATAKVSVAA